VRMRPNKDAPESRVSGVHPRAGNTSANSRFSLAFSASSARSRFVSLNSSRRGNSLNLHRHRDPAIYPHVCRMLGLHCGSSVYKGMNVS
jgi:hypothetical protein